MTEGLSVLVCDDREARRTEWIEAIEKIELAVPTSVKALGYTDFIRSFGELKRRRIAARPSDDTEHAVAVPFDELPPNTNAIEPCDIDNVDILVVDYALAEFEREADGDAYLTGSLVARLARCYSSVGIIVGVNQYGENPFDLTLMRGFQSFADVDVGQEQLLVSGLWKPAWAGFRPWNWPVLGQLPGLMTGRVAACLDNHDVPVLELLGLAHLTPYIPRESLGALELPGTPAERVTVEQVARQPKHGLVRGEYPSSQDAVARIAAARITKWMETALLPMQDVLIDAPHLASRNASLLAGDPAQVASWDATCDLSGDASKALVASLAEHQYVNSIWTTRPLWRWPDLQSDPHQPGVDQPWTIPSSDLVFAEDLSSFIERTAARRLSFRGGSMTTRWVGDPTKVASLQNIVYEPERRLVS